MVLVHVMVRIRLNTYSEIVYCLFLLRVPLYHTLRFPVIDGGGGVAPISHPIVPYLTQRIW